MLAEPAGVSTGENQRDPTAVISQARYPGACVRVRRVEPDSAVPPGSQAVARRGDMLDSSGPWARARGGTWVQGKRFPSAKLGYDLGWR